MSSPTRLSSAPTAKGTRQPHDDMALSDSDDASTAARPDATSCPIVVETYWKLEKNPRRCAGADSTRKVVDAANSPPTDRPWTSRATTSRTGERTPTWAYVGSTATSRDPAPMSRMVRVSAALRPSRSATAPMSSPPTGRMKKPTAKTAKASSSDVSPPSPWGNTWVAKYVARKE